MELPLRGSVISLPVDRNPINTLLASAMLLFYLYMWFCHGFFMFKLKQGVLCWRFAQSEFRYLNMCGSRFCPQTN